MSAYGAFTPSTPLYARHSGAGGGSGSGSGNGSAFGPGSGPSAAASSQQSAWGGFPSQPHQQQQQPPMHGSLQRQPTTPGIARSGSGFFLPQQAQLEQLQQQQQQPLALVSAQQPAPPATLALTPTVRASAPAPAQSLQVRSGITSSPFARSSAVANPTPTPAKMPAPPTLAGPQTQVQPFTRAILLSRIRWNALALIGLFVLPSFGPVRGTLYLVYGFVSVLSAGLLDPAAESLGEYTVLLAKIVLVINLIDAIVRLQSKAAEEKAAGVQTVTAGTPKAKGPSAKLALGVRSSPQTRPSPSLNASPSADRSTQALNPRRAPLVLQPSLRATLDEASFLATPSRSSGAVGVASTGSPGMDSPLGLGASGRRWPSGSPANSLRAGLGNDEASQRNISPVQVFRARRAASGRGRTASGLAFDSSFDVGDDDGSTESHEVEYGLKVLNSSFSADRSPFSGAMGASAPMPTPSVRTH